MKPPFPISQVPHAVRPEAARTSATVLVKERPALQALLAERAYRTRNLCGGFTLLCGLRCSLQAVRLGRARKDRRRRPRRQASLPPMLHTTSGKKQLKKTISWFLEQRGDTATKKMLDDMKVLGFDWATKAGISLGVEDMRVPEKKADLCDGTKARSLDAEDRYGNGDITVVERFLKVTDEWAKASEDVKNEAIRNFEENDPTNSVYMMSVSGARGNVSQVRQLLAMRGLMADANGQIIDVPITHCLREGMTVTDMLISGNGARKGIIDTALRTADSGYLYRRLDFAGSDSVVLATDCGTPETVPMHLRGRGAPFDERIRGRVLGADLKHPLTSDVLHRKGDLLTEADAVNIAQEWTRCEEAGHAVPAVHIRSALTCKLAKGICGKCCGEDLSKRGVLAAVGYPAGVIAAQSMGEPGTQLTMRTFHTGGAFEGSAGKGIVAKDHGVVSLVGADEAPIKPSMAVGGIVEKWTRTQHGDVAGMLAGEASLALRGQDGRVLQEESLPRGTLVYVHDGQEVSLGQILFQVEAALEEITDESALETIAKPITSVEDGEIFISEADVVDGHLPSSAKLVWVLKGSRASVSDTTGRSVDVKAGDFVAAGTPLALQWSTSRDHGVVRCLPVPASEKCWDRLRPPVLRSVDKNEESTLAEKEEVSSHEKLHIVRTDFGCFFLPGCIAEYQVDAVPPCVSETLSLPGIYDIPQSVHARGGSSCVHAYLKNGASELNGMGPPSVGFITASPKGEASLLCPVGQELHPQHVVPCGGLVFHVQADSGDRAILWSAEEFHRMRASEEYTALRETRHGVVHAAGTEILMQDAPLLRTKASGCFCLYVRCEGPAEPVVVQEESGILRRECWDRLSSDEPSGMVECIVKPGVVVTLPSGEFDSTWYSVPRDHLAQGVHLHEKLVPKGVSFLPQHPHMKNESQWQVVELLDDPRDHKNCRVLLRPARWIPIPAAAPPETPDGASSLSSWGALYSNGERFDSNSPAALVCEIVSSLSRHAMEPHCVSISAHYHDTASPQSSVISSTTHANDNIIAPRGVGIHLARPWQFGDLSVTQHTPPRFMKLARSDSVVSEWGERPLKHQVPAIAVSSADAVAPATAILQLSSPSAAYVYKVSARSETSKDIAMVVPDDCVLSRCHSQPSVHVGQFVRQRKPLSHDVEATVAGRVLCVEKSGSEFVLTQHLGRAHLFTSLESVGVRDEAMVTKGDVLGTENLVIPKTTDIVQGLPRITALFEATATSGVHKIMQEMFQEEKAKGLLGLDAAKSARDRFQRWLVEEIQSVYLSQGVNINAKHIEIIVRRMCEGCEVVQSQFASWAAGTLATYNELEQFQALHPSGKIDVRPKVLGITRIGRGKHLLVSMSFRELDSILTTSLRSGPPTFPLFGIKENLMVGKAIAVGTNAGVAAELMSTDSANSWSHCLDMCRIPDRDAKPLR